MINIIKPTFVLVIVAFISSLVLSHIDKITKPDILRQAQEKQDRALALVLPGYKISKKETVTIRKKTFRYWVAVKQEKGSVKKAYAFEASSPGYSGEVKSMVGVDEKGTLLGLSILKQTETPGLGARCEEIATSVTFLGFLQGKNSPPDEITQPWFQYQFNGLSLMKPVKIAKKGDWKPSIKDELLAKNSITAITGATITGKAVITGLTSAKALLDEALKLKKENFRGAGR